MQTKDRAYEFLHAFWLLALLILIPTFAVGRLLAPPFNLLGWAIVLTFAWLVIHRRERQKRVREWRTGRSPHRISGHGAS